MKTIQLSKTTEKHNGQDVEMSTIEMIRVAANTSEGGVSVEEMKKRLRIIGTLDALPEGAQSLDLEDADFANLGKYVKAIKWNIISQFIVDFSKQFE